MIPTSEELPSTLSEEEVASLATELTKLRRSILPREDQLRAMNAAIAKAHQFLRMQKANSKLGSALDALSEICEEIEDRTARIVGFDINS